MVHDLLFDDRNQVLNNQVQVIQAQITILHRQNKDLYDEAREKKKKKKKSDKQQDKSSVYKMLGE
jgi:hypothetical protein